jgi:serine protease Do
MIGEWVIAFGNPFGLFTLNDKPTVTVGVISSTGMNLEPLDNRFYLDMIQTDAAINGGNSGGPLANSVGEVIGMNTLIYTNGGTGNIGLGFAIPINKVKKIIKQLKEKGKVDRNFDVGLNIQDIDDGIANYYKLKNTRGVIVNQVIANSPAARAGIQDGDIILQLDKYLINNQQTLIGAFQQFTNGETVTIKILRNNKEIIKQMKLEKSS